MYALERVGILANLPAIGGADWYRLGADWLIRRQGRDGSWNYRGRSVGTALGLLFLGKGRAPVLITKLRLQSGSVARVGEVDALTKQASRIFKRRFTWQSASTSTPAAQILMAPIVFINGYRAFKPTASVIALLRRLLDNDATLVINACSPIFDRTFRKQLGRVFPQAKLTPLEPDHPIYSSQYRIDDPRLKFLEGVSWNCRMPIIYSRKDLSYGWSTAEAHHGLAGDWARKIGLNIVRYIAGKGQKLDRLRKVELVRGKAKIETGRPAKVPPGAFIPAMLRHGGDWNPDPEVMGLVLDDLRKTLPLRTGRVARSILLTDKNLFNYPFLLIKGHRSFSLAQAEIDRLRRYLKAGGTLMAECCCGNPVFDRSLRKLAALLFPQQPLARLSASHAIFSRGKAMAPIRFTKVSRRKPGLPPLEGVTLSGRTALLYLPMAAGCAISGHSRPQCTGILQRKAALALYRRIVLYVMTR